MSQLKIIFVGSLALWLGITAVEKLNQPSTANFVEVPTLDGVAPGQVVVSGLLDCPHSGKNTRGVLDKLTAAQIPFKHVTSFGISDTDDWDGVQRLSQIAQRGSPIVFVNGKAKANPNPEEVIAEYKKAGR